MSNISSIISGYNKNLLNPSVTQNGCNCRIREDCPPPKSVPVDKYYLQSWYVHCEANKDYTFYFGVAKTPFKERDFNHKQHIKSTELCKYIWLLKDAKTPYNINWSIVAKVKNSAKINYCLLCLTEKYHLIKYFNDTHLLKKKDDFINACRHQSKLLLQNLKRNDSMDWKNIKETCRKVFLYFR